MSAGAGEATRRPWESPSLRTNPRGMPRGMLHRTRLPGGRASGGPPRRTRPRYGGEVTSPPWTRPRGQLCGVPSRARPRRKKGGWAAASDATAGGPPWPSPRQNICASAAGDVVADEAAGRRGSGTGDRRRIRDRRTAAGRVASADKASSVEGRGAGTCRRDAQGRWWAMRCGRGRGRGERSPRTQSRGPGLPPRMRPQDGRGRSLTRWMWPCRKAARMLDERCRRCLRGQWTTREGRHFPWTHVAAKGRLVEVVFGRGCPGGREGAGTATRRQGHGTAAEVVASVDVTVPTAVGDVAHVKMCPLSAYQSRAPHFATALFVCVLCPLLLILSFFVFGTPPNGRKIFQFFQTPK